MRIAIPMKDGQFCEHFGRSTSFMLCEVDVAHHRIARPRVIDRKATGCDSLPNWLADLAVHTVVVGGIGAGAIMSLTERGIAVSPGHVGQSTDQVLEHFFDLPRGDANHACHAHDHETHHCRSDA